MNVNIDISKIRLETAHLLLRPFCEDDLSDFYEYASVPGVGEMAGWPHHENIETSKGILKSFIEEKEVLALQHKNTGKVIGSLGLHYSWANDDPRYSGMKSKEIGYVLARDYWGQGLIPEAVKTVIAMCFNEYDCEILTCGHFSTNNQSKRVIEKCGFRFEKQSVFHSKQLNVDYEDMKYVLLRSDWLGSCFIRSAQFSDAAALADTLCCSWSAAFSEILTAEDLAKNVKLQKRTEMFEDILKIDGIHNIIAIDGKNPCGFCSYGKSRDNDPSDYGEIIAIHTKPEYWGKGVGKALMDRALLELRRQGYSQVILWTFERNSRARHFYEKYGFVNDGMIKDSGFANAKETRYRLELDT